MNNLIASAFVSASSQLISSSVINLNATALATGSYIPSGIPFSGCSMAFSMLISPASLIVFNAVSFSSWLLSSFSASFIRSVYSSPYMLFTNSAMYSPLDMLPLKVSLSKPFPVFKTAYPSIAAA